MNYLFARTSNSLLRDHLKLNLFNQISIKETRAISFSLPLFSDNNRDFRPSEELAKERYDIRAGEDVDRKRARLLYQSRKRGMLENGVILASFADKYLFKLNEKELDEYDRLINLPTNDWDIFYWATKTKPTPPEFETPVMDKLRQHLHSKVSSESDDVISNGSSILHNKRSEEIVAPFAKKKYPLKMDIHEADFTSYEKDLFDNRVKNLNKKESIVYMTEWRKQRFVSRMRRAISSPISLRHLKDDKLEKLEVYGQKIDEKSKSIARDKVSATDVIDTNYEKNMKHHHVLQHMLSSELTDDAEDYDEEAQAWADILWHRSYGFADVNIAPVGVKCKTCESILHCCDPGLNGYVPKELFSSLYDPMKSKQINCQRCQFKSTYNVSLDADVSEDEFRKVLSELREKPRAVVCILIDLTDFPSGIYSGIIDLIGPHHRIIVVGNKLDLLPYDSAHMIDRVKESLSENISKLRLSDKNLQINDLVAISARTGFGVEGLASRILSFSEEPKDVYLIGTANSGKSTLFNALLQSDLCAVRDTDLMSRISKAELTCNINILRFPVNLLEGWELEMKRRKSERVERDTARYERSFQNNTMFRQATTPHMELLINRVEFLPCGDNSELTTISTDDQTQIRDNTKPMFSEDHPLKHVHESQPLIATPEKYPHNSFCYQLPSVHTEDQLHNLLTTEERLHVFPHETISPRKYSIRPLQSIFLAGLARLDLVSSTSNVIITFFASRYLPIYVVPTKKADQFYKTFVGSSYLGVPFGDEERMKWWPNRLETSEQAKYLIRGTEHDNGLADVVFGSAGWALVDVSKDQECIVKAYTPHKKGIYLRNPPLIRYARESIKGKKIRDTPLFENPNYKTDYRISH